LVTSLAIQLFVFFYSKKVSPQFDQGQGAAEARTYFVSSCGERPAWPVLGLKALRHSGSLTALQKLEESARAYSLAAGRKKQ
jgi:hypothetical protein